MNILIVGAGIAGCSAAIALANAGHQVRVLEKQSEWQFQSSGIFVYSNGLSVLQDLGVLDDILDAGFAIPDGVNSYFDHHGNQIVETRYPPARGGAVPAIVGIKRAELHRVLASRMKQLAVSVMLGANIVSIEQTDSGASATLEGGSVHDCDLLIGADGVHSWVRDQIAPEFLPQYSGFGVWRSVHQRPAGLRHKIMMMGVTKRYGIMPISDDKLYTFGTVLHFEKPFIPADTWVDQMRAQFSEFTGPAAPFLSELSEHSEVFFTAVEEVVMPLPWHRGRVLLIGDACHASTPFMGQGGAMAMQDALVLERALAKKNTVPHALALFGEARLPVCRFVQDVSRAVGKAGANIEAENASDRLVKFSGSAQKSVDAFYSRLTELNDEADSMLKA